MAISKINVNGTEHELQTTIANVSGLQSALDGKAASSHGNHVPSCSTSNNGQVLCVINGVPAWQTINNVVPSAEGVNF